jgi:hypothetical protein
MTLEYVFGMATLNVVGAFAVLTIAGMIGDYFPRFECELT